MSTPRLRSQGQTAGIYRKVLCYKILMWNIKALVLSVQNFCATLKFKTEWENRGMTDRTKTICPHPQSSISGA